MEKKEFIISWFVEAQASGAFEESEEETLQLATSRTELSENTSDSRRSVSGGSSPL